jgi:hypothetical protein
MNQAMNVVLACVCMIFAADVTLAMNKAELIEAISEKSGVLHLAVGAEHGIAGNGEAARLPDFRAR